LCAKAIDGEYAGVLPLVRLKSRLFGDFLVSLPYVNYGGVLAVSEPVARMLLQRAVSLAESLGSKHVEIRDSHPHAGPWAMRTDKVLMKLALPSSDEELWQGFDSKLRSQIKRARKEAIEVMWGGAELLPEFYYVFSRNMRDLGTPVYSQHFFESILRHVGDAASVIVARYRGRGVAAGFLLGSRNELEIPWASSVREFNRLGVNMLLYWTALVGAIERGYKIFDFGRSSVGSGTFNFKKQWGAVDTQLYWHYWLRPGTAMPNLTPTNSKFRLAIELWKRLPLFVTNQLGPVLAKNLP
jgi:FemAB-related protein (PEP-CTERM system-associated)